MARRGVYWHGGRGLGSIIEDTDRDRIRFNIPSDDQNEDAIEGEVRNNKIAIYHGCYGTIATELESRRIKNWINARIKVPQMFQEALKD